MNPTGARSSTDRLGRKQHNLDNMVVPRSPRRRLAPGRCGAAPISEEAFWRVRLQEELWTTQSLSGFRRVGAFRIPEVTMCRSRLSSLMVTGSCPGPRTWVPTYSSRHKRSLFLFAQGHPEYDASVLLARIPPRYRKVSIWRKRRLSRVCLSATSTSRPTPLSELRMWAHVRRDIDVLLSFPATAHITLTQSWQLAALKDLLQLALFPK